DSTNATASALNCSEYNFDMINILPCPAPAKQARRQPNPQQTPATDTAPYMSESRREENKLVGKNTSYFPLGIIS
ncbi:hypothetical protein, partial [Corynebacterium belfantii]|uniref:hypothetical protein n=1 Tax=Corynebacterium belfantii TaxID=2014537 RepID=UPI001A7EDB6D